MKIISNYFLIILIFFSAKAFSADQTTNIWNIIKGEAPNNKLYLGMWTAHFSSSENRSNRWNNELIGGVYHSIFIGTFINSYDKRGYAIGIQRDLFTKSFSPNVYYEFGYRIGGVTGYDEKMIKLARNSKILPFGQLISDLSYRRIGWELTYTGAIVSTSFYIKFG